MTAIVARSYTFTHHLRCLIVSMEIHKKLLMQKSSHQSILSPVIDRYASSCFICDNTVCKRFYSQATINQETDEISDAQLKLDELLSNPENKKRYHILELEIDVMRHSRFNVPEQLKPDNWLMLLKLPSKRQRKKYLCYLWYCEDCKRKAKLRKEMNRTHRLAWKEAKAKQSNDTAEIRYGLPYNSMFRLINLTTINHYYNAKLMQVMMFAPKVVFDCSYENYMTPLEINKCAKLLTLSFAYNRTHVDPMCLYYCNLNKNGLLMKHFQRHIPTLLNDDFPAIVTSQSYLDLFQRDQLLYLTPHCTTDITEYDSDTVYIIGAMVDKTNVQPLSLAKAKKEGIRMGKLPLEKYLNWRPHLSKSFTIDQMINVLLDLKHTGDWKKALQHVYQKLPESRQHKQKKLNKNLKNMETQESMIETEFTFNRRKIDYN